VFTEAMLLSGFFLRGPQQRVFVAGVEVKAAFHADSMSAREVKML
jgi:hypothetical protein